MRTLLLALSMIFITGEGLLAADRPNVILIIGDDLGWGDIGANGCKDVPTPNIDSLAANGVRFTNGYVSCPVCSPTRAGLITGRYQQRFGHEFNPGPPRQAEPQFGLPLTEKTLADRMRDAGYATGMVGKWHLGYQPAFHPLKRGFDSFFGFLGGAHSYLDPKADTANMIMRGTESVDEKEYLTRAFAREAKQYIRDHHDKPFFLYLTFNAVHSPLHIPADQSGAFGGIADEKRRKLAVMLSELDKAVGDVLDTLREQKIEDNTFVIFHSDNGGPTRNNGSQNGPLSGFKGQVLEGGIRVPFVMQWKAKLPAGATFEHPVIALDTLPTALAAAGSEVAASDSVDGVNLLPYLTGSNDQPPHAHLFWRFGPQAAVRAGDWKLRRTDDEGWKLFNLADDVGEQTDLAASQADKAKELAGAYEAWNATLSEPRWKGRQPRRARAASEN